MADDTKDPTALRERLWKELEHETIGMLGLVGGEPHHMQPMAVYADEPNHAVWFYSNKDSDLARDAQGHDAMLCLMSKDMDFQACLHGKLSLSHDQTKIDQYWSPFVAAWFPEGKADPGLTLIRMDLDDARVWASKRGPFNYPFQIAKANATHTLPDVGGVADVRP